ncbi:SDR family oxidoreductase [Cupriavidus numazuensis]|uniref:Short-chain dehydrogenase n=1 Tax=Cupriavidus numazuensis TaxID=221992 RepID=A0ABN7QHI2_9BURK|nr:SDR family oxidoreductase [Cupriavidus numazuensis]CAG2161245.1 hypothetical protein LMG26411_08100 [Cupriavidus numazuensis]
MKIEDAVVLVTGANRGLGGAFVRALIKAGARKVYAASRDPSKVDIEGAIPVRLDIANEVEVAAAAEQCADVNLLVNNAGIGLPSAFLAEDGVQKARALLETNFFGTLLVSRAFAPVLKRNGGGVLVNMLSVTSWINLPTSSGYCASKTAGWALTNGLRNELRSQGTRVIGVHAGFIDTDMAKHVSLPKISSESVAAQVVDAIRGDAEEVFADELSRQVKAGLSANPGVYLRAPAL